MSIFTFNFRGKLHFLTTFVGGRSNTSETAAYLTPISEDFNPKVKWSMYGNLLGSVFSSIDYIEIQRINYAVDSHDLRMLVDFILLRHGRYWILKVAEKILKITSFSRF